jgi:hypothetical protein
MLFHTLEIGVSYWRSRCFSHASQSSGSLKPFRPFEPRGLPAFAIANLWLES